MHSASDRDRLALTTGKRPNGLLRVADINAHVEQFGLTNRFSLLGIEATEGPRPLGGFIAQEEVPPDGHQGNRCQILEHRGDAIFEGIARRREPLGRSVHQELAFAWLMDSTKDLDQRRLTSAVVTQDAGHAAVVDMHRHVAQRNDAAEALRDIDQLKGGGYVSHLRTPWNRRLMSVLTSTAANRIKPRNSQDQSVFQRA